MVKVPTDPLTHAPRVVAVLSYLHATANDNPANTSGARPQHDKRSGPNDKLSCGTDFPRTPPPGPLPEAQRGRGDRTDTHFRPSFRHQRSSLAPVTCREPLSAVAAMSGRLSPS